TDYHKWQMSWLDRLDAVAANGSGVVTACAQYIKPPLDSIVAKSRLLTSALQSHNVVAYATAATGQATSAVWHEGHIQFHPLLGDPPLAGELLPLIAKMLGLPFETQAISPATSVAQPTRRSRARRAIASRLGPVRAVASLAGRRHGRMST